MKIAYTTLRYRPFGCTNLRSAFDQVRALERNGYGKNGEYVCFDVHPFRTTKEEHWMAHLVNSRSTFLKLVTNVIQPTSGSLRVVGDVHALLQIGTGFHPDFTGRENVRAYLAQLGVSGAEANQRCDDAIAFAELEEYIDQPVKVYSTGMAMRLMFAASTAITPDLLVLDEVLGVGDAYFAQKSYERMRELCERNGSTLLLVTHDIYSATRMCDRVIWLDRGVVAMDGAAADVVKAYAESIRGQEERRLRLKKQSHGFSTATERQIRRWDGFERRTGTANPTAFGCGR